MRENNNELLRSAKDAFLYRKQLTVYLEESAKIITESNLAGIDDYIFDLRNQSEDLKKGVFRILVMGDFNRGKSSLLNILLQTDLLPTDVLACTALLAKVKFGKSKNIKIHFKDSRRSPEICRNLNEFHKQYSIPPEARTSQNLDEQSVFPHISHAEIESDIELLEKGVEFIDTPGLSRSEGDNKITVSYIKNCQAIIFVLDSSGAQFSMSDREYLKKYLYPYLINIDQSLPKVFFVLNKWDLLRNPSDQERVKDFFEKAIADALDTSVTKIKSLWNKRLFITITENQNGNQFDNIENPNLGISELRQAMGDFLQKDRLKAEFEQGLVTLFIASSQTEAQLKRVYANLRESKESIESKIRDAQNSLKIIENILSDLDKNITEKMLRTSENISKSFTETISGKINNLDVLLADIKLEGTFISEKKIGAFQKRIEEKCMELLSIAIQDWTSMTKHRLKMN